MLKTLFGMFKTPCILPIASLCAMLFFIAAPEPARAQDSIQDGNQKKIQIFVTIEPLIEFTESVGGEMVEVNALVPQGANPHTFEPRPGVLRKFAKADMLITVGTGLEFETAWVDKLIDLNKEVKVVKSSQGVRLIESDHNAGHPLHSDPHVWLSPLNAIKMVENIYSALSEYDAGNKHHYLERTQRYTEELHTLDKSIRRSLRSSRIDAMLVYHPSWGYFADEYGIKQTAIEKDGKEPTLKNLVEIANTMKHLPNGVIIASSEFNDKHAQVLAKELQCPVVFFSPLARYYIENLTRVVSALVEVKGEQNRPYR